MIGYSKHFDFCDWKSAFETYYKETDSNKVFIVSIHPYSSGYWIVRAGSPTTEYDFKNYYNTRQ